MGGGDLNMKKSWHPQRLDNVEKVWQREEAQKAERRRMEELRREIQEEKSMEDMRKRGEDMGILKKQKDRLDWMYKGPGSNVNRDDYLLGKEIDKTVMDAPMESAAADSSGSALAQSLTVDIATKVKEDPLFAIKKREISGRKELLNNPIRMKQLQQLLKKEVSKKDKKKRKKEKKEKKKLKKKKHHKSKHQSYSSSASSSEEEPSPVKISKMRTESPVRSSKHGDHDGDRHSHRRPGYGLVGGRRNMDDHIRQRRDRDSSEERQMTRSNYNKHQDTISKHRGRDELPDERFKDRTRRQTSHDVQRHSDRQSDKDRHREERHRSRSRSRSPQKRKSFSPLARKQRRSRSYSPKHKKRLASPSPRQQRRRPRSPSPKQRKSRSMSPQQWRRQPRSPSPRGQRRRSKSPSPRHQRRSSTSPSPRQQRRRSRSPSPRQQRRRSRSPSPRQQRRRSRSPSPMKQRRRSRSQSPRKLRRKSGSQSPRFQRRRSSSSSSEQETRHKAQPRKKMDADEMARKRAEMMDNAKWRDDQRMERVKQYQAEEHAEIEDEKKKSKSAKFLKTMKLPANSSVEDRIKSNIHNIQRTRAALDKNFARK